MSEIVNILPSHLSKANETEKRIFFQVLICLANIDDNFDADELTFIKEAAKTHGIENLEELYDYGTPQKVIEQVKVIHDRHLAMELVREMCILSHVDNYLSDSETLFIGQIGLALGIELEKIEQISNWIIDRIIWLEQAKIIFEEDI